MLYGKKGKNGVQKLKFKNDTEIFHDGEKAIIIQRQQPGVDISLDNFTIPLEYINDINPMNIYRALVKFVLAVIGNDEINYFWIL